MVSRLIQLQGRSRSSSTLATVRQVHLEPTRAQLVDRPAPALGRLGAVAKPRPSLRHSARNAFGVVVSTEATSSLPPIVDPADHRPVGMQSIPMARPRGTV